MLSSNLVLAFASLAIAQKSSNPPAATNWTWWGTQQGTIPSQCQTQCNWLTEAQKTCNPATGDFSCICNMSGAAASYRGCRDCLAGNQQYQVISDSTKQLKATCNWPDDDNVQGAQPGTGSNRNTGPQGSNVVPGGNPPYPAGATPVSGNDGRVGGGYGPPGGVSGIPGSVYVPGSGYLPTSAVNGFPAATAGASGTWNTNGPQQGQPGQQGRQGNQPINPNSASGTCASMAGIAAAGFAVVAFLL